MHLGFARQKKKLSVCVCLQLEAAEREQSLYHLWRKIRVTIADEKIVYARKAVFNSGSNMSSIRWR